jgi:type I restriction enzyme S subunit
MSIDLLLREFERVSEAPDGVPSLRRFVVDLAVRGRLVQQNRNDESAYELIRKIEEDKTRVRKGWPLRNV